MANVHIIEHPLIKNYLTVLRDKDTPSDLFRIILRRLSALMAYDVTRDLQLKPFAVETPLETTQGFSLANDIVLVPVLRAGLGMIGGFMDFMPQARVGHIGMYRNEETLQPVDYYSKFPQNLQNSVIILLDPMLATGGSSTAAVSFIKQKGAQQIKFVCLVAAPEGVKFLTEHHPDLDLYAAVLDRQLNERGYILPGLGDAGDRMFGTE
jgi:uracil phosphoribosyltransferase